MKKRLIQSLILGTFLLVITYAAYVENKKEVKNFETDSPRAGVCDIYVKLLDLPPDTADSDIVVVAEEEPEVIFVPPIETSWLYEFYIKMGFSREKFYEDLDLLAAITMAEAGNQSELGKRLVIDTVLNRIWSDNWRDDNTIWETVVHPGQFDTYSNGAYKRVAIDEDIYRLIEEELLNQTNSQVTYFKTNGYFSGVPSILQEGDHYFSGDSER